MMSTPQHDRALVRLADMAARQRTLAARPARLLLSGLLLLCGLLGQIQLPAHALTHLQDNVAATGLSGAHDDASPAAGADTPAGDAHAAGGHHVSILFCDLCAAGQPATLSAGRLSSPSPLAPPGLTLPTPADLPLATLQRPLARAPPARLS